MSECCAPAFSSTGITVRLPRLYSFRRSPKRHEPISPLPKKGLAGRWLDIEETRLVSDLRIMHSKVDELHNVVENLKHKHQEADIVKYADYEALGEDIRKVDETYLWFVKVKEQRDGSKLGD